MRILVVALGGAGHCFPLVPLALALRDAGHGVTFAVGPESRDTIATTGLDVAVVGVAMREAFDAAMARRGLSARPTDPAVVGQVAGEVFGEVFPRAFDADVGGWIERHRPDVVVAEAGCPGAAIAAVRTGTPCVTHSFGRRPDAGSPMGMQIRAMLGRLSDEMGLGPLRAGGGFGHAYLDICPPSLQSPPAAEPTGPELPLRATPWNPPGPFDAPEHHRPWVYVTLGTAMGDAGLLRTAVAGLTGLGVDVLVATGSVDAGELADLDGGPGGAVRVAPFVPQADLLAGRLGPPPALVVHHGGSGTTLATAAAGVPHLVLPQGADQFSNASALVAAGVAWAFAGPGETTPAVVTPDDVVAAAGALLAEGPARAASRALAAEVAAMPSPADVAATVEQWAVPESTPAAGLDEVGLADRAVDALDVIDDLGDREVGGRR